MTSGAKWPERDVGEALFPVKLQPVYFYPFGNTNEFRKLRRHFAVTDMERGEEIAVVTDDYKLVTNEQAYGMAKSAMKKVFKMIDMSDLQCLNITMPKNRTFCHIDLIHRNADFSPWETDKWTAFLRITNSYNKTRLLRFELGFCRWICLNGMIFGAKSIKFSYAHTKRGMDKVHGFTENIGDISKLELQLTERLHQLKRYHVPKEEMLPLFCQALEIEVDEPAFLSNIRISQLQKMKAQVYEIINRYFSEMGAHGYAALNVLTEYATQPAGVISSEACIHGYQRKANDWMQHFIAAISQTNFSFENYINIKYRKTAQNIENIPMPPKEPPTLSRVA